jgi:hypothetical protein
MRLAPVRRPRWPCRASIGRPDPRTVSRCVSGLRVQRVLPRPGPVRHPSVDRVRVFHVGTTLSGNSRGGGWALPAAPLRGASMALSPYWRGFIRLSLVSVPVRAYTAFPVNIARTSAAAAQDPSRRLGMFRSFRWALSWLWLIVASIVVAALVIYCTRFCNHRELRRLAGYVGLVDDFWTWPEPQPREIRYWVLGLRHLIGL